VLVPEGDRALRALPRIKNELAINVELASPADFIPVPAGWQDRSAFVAREGKLSYHHFDLYAQALAKLERAHQRDLEDVAAMLDRGLVDPAQALEYFDQIEPELYRFPAIDPLSFRRRVVEVLTA
jgi:non-ribosomal peptide synthetase component F